MLGVWHHAEVWNSVSPFPSSFTFTPDSLFILFYYSKLVVFLTSVFSFVLLLNMFCGSITWGPQCLSLYMVSFWDVSFSLLLLLLTWIIFFPNQQWSSRWRTESSTPFNQVLVLVEHRWEMPQIFWVVYPHTFLAFYSLGEFQRFRLLLKGHGFGLSSQFHQFLYILSWFIYL